MVRRSLLRGPHFLTKQIQLRFERGWNCGPAPKSALPWTAAHHRSAPTASLHDERTAGAM